MSIKENIISSLHLIWKKVQHVCLKYIYTFSGNSIEMDFCIKSSFETFQPFHHFTKMMCCWVSDPWTEILQSHTANYWHKSDNRWAGLQPETRQVFHSEDMGAQKFPLTYHHQVSVYLKEYLDILGNKLFPFRTQWEIR